MHASGVIYSSRLMGCEVQNKAGERLGRLAELVLDADGRLAYGVLGFGGGVLAAARLCAVPWTALELSEDETSLLLDIEKSALESAPSFDRRHWPRMADPRWGAAVHAFFRVPFAQQYQRPEVREPAVVA